MHQFIILHVTCQQRTYYCIDTRNNSLAVNHSVFRNEIYGHWDLSLAFIEPFLSYIFTQIYGTVIFYILIFTQFAKCPKRRKSNKQKNCLGWRARPNKERIDTASFIHVLFIYFFKIWNNDIFLYWRKNKRIEEWLFIRNRTKINRRAEIGWHRCQRRRLFPLRKELAVWLGLLRWIQNLLDWEAYGFEF